MSAHDLPEAMLDRLAARCSNAGRWGASDCMGTLNLATPSVRGKAAALVSAGRSLALDSVCPPPAASA
jgi:hypothetical protein